MVPADFGGPLRRLDDGLDPDHVAAVCDLACGGALDLCLLQPQAQRVREGLRGGCAQDRISMSGHQCLDSVCCTVRINGVRVIDQEG
jgi:hypothetical protein